MQGYSLTPRWLTCEDITCLFALQLKELLAPYGQLKSLSVAMDAATGKNKVGAKSPLAAILAAIWQVAVVPRPQNDE